MSSLESAGRDVLVILLNGLWQGPVIAGITWCALRLSPRANASTRYAAWTLALIATVLVPVLTSLPHISYERAATLAASSPTHVERRTASEVPPPVEPAAQTAQTAAPISLPHAPAVRVAPPALLTSALFALWALAAAALLVRLVVALLQLERLKRDALPLGMTYRESLEQWQASSGRSRDVRICVTNGIEVPVAVGLFDAMVLLPQHLLDTLDASEIDQISLHELAHLLRHDDWSNAFQRLVTALLFFNPAVWFVARQMDIEREVACDDYVLVLTGAVRTYAYCLTKMAEMTAWPHEPLAAPGVFITRKNISIRIERLLRTGRAISSSISPATAVAVLAGLVAVFIVARALTPVVAFALPSTPQVAVRASTPPHHADRTHQKAAHVRSSASSEAKPQPDDRPRIFPSPRARTVASVDVPPIDVPGIDVPAVHVSPIHIAAMHVAVGSSTATGSCSGCDFAHARLSGKDFSNQRLAGSDFDDADLSFARFDRSDLSGANFRHANLHGASFVGADLTGCDLGDADLSGARFDGAKLEGCTVDVSHLSPEQTRFFLKSCTGCDFSNANLQGVDLRGIKMTGTDLAGASLRDTNLSGAVLTGVNFAGADFTGANLDKTTFSGCDFDGANLSRVDLRRANFVGSSLAGAIMNR